MLVSNCIVETKVVTAGMLVRDVFAECGKKHVQALPFVDHNGKITGRVTLKNIMKFSCLPEHMIDLAPLLGSFLSCVDNAAEKINHVMCSPVDSYVRKAGTFIAPEEPAIKALALMAQHDTSYLFVVDGDSYCGVVTIQAIAERMSEIAVCPVD
jgi:CBS-domain-containing membrane protein